MNDGFRAGGSQDRGTAPDLYISQAALQELFPQYRVFRVAFDTDGQRDENILQELKLITASRSNIDVISRYERREEMQDYLITAKVLGTGLSVILLLVGVMNFVNIMVVNVNTRRYELAILESVGMTKRQIKRMLSMEGFLGEKLIAEAEGIFLWCLEGLHRLIDNGYQFTIRKRVEDNLTKAMQDGNNIIVFMESEGYIRLEKGTHATSKQFTKNSVFKRYSLMYNKNGERR